jgi:hypothetical protein
MITPSGRPSRTTGIAEESWDSDRTRGRTDGTLEPPGSSGTSSGPAEGLRRRASLLLQASTAFLANRPNPFPGPRLARRGGLGIPHPLADVDGTSGEGGLLTGQTFLSAHGRPEREEGTSRIKVYPLRSEWGIPKLFLQDGIPAHLRVYRTRASCCSFSRAPGRPRMEPRERSLADGDHSTGNTWRHPRDVLIVAEGSPAPAAGAKELRPDHAPQKTSSECPDVQSVPATAHQSAGDPTTATVGGGPNPRHRHRYHSSKGTSA